MGLALTVSLPRDRLEISPEARQALSQLQLAQAEAPQPEDDPLAGLAPRDRIRIMILERFLGVKIRLVRRKSGEGAGGGARTGQAEQRVVGASADASGPQRYGWGFRYKAREIYQESEQLSFSANGVINTADNKQIDFSLQVNLSREFRSESYVSIKAGDALIDPLVINYDGPAAQLSPDLNLRFDLDLNGTQDQLAYLQEGSGFLALDKDGDGAINDGSELFGPSTGDGFAELAQYDVDGNRWIDENDPIYERLRIWAREGAGEPQLFALGAKGVGAIYLGGIDAAFTMKDGANQTQAQVRQMSVYAREDGTGVGSVQQLDVVV